MDRNLLLEDLGFKDFTSIDELRDHLKKDSLAVKTIDGPSSIRFNQDSNGLLQADVTGEKYNFTKNGFDIFCKIFKVPPKFVKDLPFENIVKDLSVSILKSPLSEVSLITRNSKIVGASTRKQPLNTLDVVDKAFATNRVDFKNIGLSNGQLIVDFTRDKTVTLSGEVFETGINLIHDGDIGDTPSLDYYFWRLVCKNGAVSKKIISLSKFSKKMTNDAVYTLLSERVGVSLDIPNAMLKDSISRMETTKIADDDRKYIKMFIGKKLDFASREDGETQYDIKIKEGSTYFDLMNFTTDFAKSLDSANQNRIERFGGSMLGYFQTTKPSSEILKGYTEFKRLKVYKEKQGV